MFGKSYDKFGMQRNMAALRWMYGVRYFCGVTPYQ